MTTCGCDGKRIAQDLTAHYAGLAAFDESRVGASLCRKSAPAPRSCAIRRAFARRAVATSSYGDIQEWRPFRSAGESQNQGREWLVPLQAKAPHGLRGAGRSCRAVRGLRGAGLGAASAVSAAAVVVVRAFAAGRGSGAGAGRGCATKREGKSSCAVGAGDITAGACTARVPLGAGAGAASAGVGATMTGAGVAATVARPLATVGSISQWKAVARTT